jgi:cytochrome c oxidase assembly protein subunit 15
MNRFQKLAIATTLATFLLIAVGGFVRAAGAGLGCPDWPRCFDQWYPPTHASQLPAHIDPALFNFRLAWIEYINRLIGVVIGFLILATSYCAYRDYRQNRPVLFSSLAALLLVAFQGWFGGQVVRYQLDPRFVTVHLLFALVIVVLLFYAAFRSFFPQRPPTADLSPGRQRLRRWLYACITLTLVQIFIGALVRGTVDLVHESSPELARSLLLDHVGLADHLHRPLGLALLVGVWVLAWKGRHWLGDQPPLQRLMMIPALITVAQFAAGAGLAYLALPPVLQVIHIVGGSLMLSTLVLLVLLCTYLPQSQT